MFRQNKKYIEIYVTWLYLVFMYILPFLLLTVLNGLIYAEVSISVVQGSSIDLRLLHHHDITKMLVVTKSPDFWL